MKKKKAIGLKYRKKSFKIETFVCDGIWKFLGLMFTRRENARALLFHFEKSKKWAIHSYFVFFPLVAVWLDRRNKIIELKIIKPFIPLIRPKKPFNTLVEIPVNKKYQRIVRLLVGGHKHL